MEISQNWLQEPCKRLWKLKASQVITVDHNISAARKFRESAPKYIYATQNFRECAGTSRKKKKKTRIMHKKADVIIIRDLLWKRFR